MSDKTTETQNKEGVLGTERNLTEAPFKRLRKTVSLHTRLTK